MTRRSTLAVLAALALGLAACSGDDPATPATAGGEATVEIDDFAYAPGTVTVEVGTTVVWSNEDATRHTVTAGTEDAPAPDDFDLEVDEQGQTVRRTFDEPGTHAYFCELHPFMTGTVEVTG